MFGSAVATFVTAKRSNGDPVRSAMEIEPVLMKAHVSQNRMQGSGINTILRNLHAVGVAADSLDIALRTVHTHNAVPAHRVAETEVNSR